MGQLRVRSLLCTFFLYGRCASACDVSRIKNIDVHKKFFTRLYVKTLYYKFFMHILVRFFTLLVLHTYNNVLYFHITHYGKVVKRSFAKSFSKLYELIHVQNKLKLNWGHIRQKNSNSFSVCKHRQFVVINKIINFFFLLYALGQARKLIENFRFSNFMSFSCLKIISKFSFLFL